MALSAAQKAQIGAWYKALQQQIPDFIPRAPQRQMIAEVAKTLAGEEGRHLAIEAPTGVGKTLSYLIPGIAIARDEQKTLVVSTANVALQDQLFTKDLPLLSTIIPGLKFTAAFGRRRYACPRNLAALAAPEDNAQRTLLDFLEDEVPASQAEQKLCTTLKTALDGGRWDGLRDRAELEVEDALWARISTDKASCLGVNCPWFKSCPFFIARREISEAEVVVANHALAIAALESDAVLPPAKNMLLVLDEGHHLPEVARDALEVSAEITPGFTKLQLDLFIKLIASCLALHRPKRLPPLAVPERLAQCADEIVERLSEAVRILAQLLPGEENAEYRFALGILPDELTVHAQRLAKLTDGLRGLAEALVNDLSERTGQYDIARLHRLILQLNRALGYFETQTRLWTLAAMAQASGAPVCKWITRERREGHQHWFLHCAGIRVSEQLEKLLWRSVPHIIITSATLRSLNSFSRFQEMSGLKLQAGDRFLALDSPFNHVEQGRLLIPQMRNEPRLENEALHLQEMAAFFRAELEKETHKGMLVLFTSQRAMQTFLGYVSELRLQLLVQGDSPRSRLIELHRQRVRNGQVSVLIGLQSFAEGLDLKGELLTQVHIHKIAFPPVDNPVVITEGEWLKTLRRYPFEVQSLPSASFTLIQQVGRLIRSHGCRGDIIIYDRRLLTKSYGKRLLEALPIFPLLQPEVPAMTEKPVPNAAPRRSGRRRSAKKPGR
ncbi:ATP-dependent DNA helicase DinG [Erwinia sp. HR93]|uniref:ATP-dependent DNA helicase DinG n=1 Tax=Erwinia sp. HR93 TaxID=3094840 RepID=UPI002ADEF00C|nr:ATP-dependent DNA helicase DinG [Erwinia sp. HR93]MEA1064511.1 ATP-dependent DNA helicase DinG [Erwinia sp. HR93]